MAQAEGETSLRGGIAIAARGLVKAYPGPHGPVPVLSGVDLDVPAGAFLTVVGASGSGKTTLLNLLGALDRPDAGTLQIAGRSVETWGETERCRFRAGRVGFVFQFHHLLPEFTAEENVMMPLVVAGAGEDDARSRARALLDRVGLAGRRDHRPAQLSGGESQRVAVARALAPGAGVVLADEPSGNLDTAQADELHNLLSSLVRERHLTFVAVTHSDRLASRADRVLRLESGQLHPA